MATTEEQDAALRLVLSIGLEENTARTVIKNPKSLRTLVEVIAEAGATQEGCPRSKGNLLNTVATRFPANALVHRPQLVKYVMAEQVKSTAQLEGAFEYLKKLGGVALDTSALEESCGVGVVVTGEQIKAAIAEAIAGSKEKLLEERYHLNTSIMLGQIGRSLKWADGQAMRAEMDSQVEALLGPKTEADLLPREKPKKAPKPSVQQNFIRQIVRDDLSSGKHSAVHTRFPPEPNGYLHIGHAKAICLNFGIAAEFAADGDAYVDDLNAEDMREYRGTLTTAGRNSPFRERSVAENLELFRRMRAGEFADGSKTLRARIDMSAGNMNMRDPAIYRIRKIAHQNTGDAWPIYPMYDYAHGLSDALEGITHSLCTLEFEDHRPLYDWFIDHVDLTGHPELWQSLLDAGDIVQWMGWKPWKITYSSEYFQQLYEFAVQLIETGHAYVCHQTKEEIESSRERREPSPWRERPVAESLALFEEMRRGQVDEGKATLRMKMDIKNENFNMFDLIAYRIKFASHPHVGDKWVIYPSYDYTHCLVDALENITHSLCTLEFETRRASYYWLLEVLDTYKPLVWEYARLNITHNVLSKRKLHKLVTSNVVHGWDDPRLYTLSGLRRRGVTAVAINAFCRDMGISRNTNLIATHRLEHHIRADLDTHSPRMLVVLRPLKVVITNLPDSHVELVEAKRFPGREEAVYPVPFSKVCFMEETDFREVDGKDYYGLAPGKSVMLRYAYPITCTGFTKDPLTGRGVMNWVACPAPGVAPPSLEVRLYEALFTVEDPAASDTWLEELNPDSLTVVQGALACPELSAAKAGDKFQFERLGYFCVDPDSTPGKMVVNRTVSLKDSVPKTVAKQ
ncbi:MAG: hypothetical protein WDW36_006995 [Sanguina aurantia]